MNDDDITSLIILLLVFCGTLSFAITSFGGDILFQLGISVCSLSRSFCQGSLLTTLAMITLMAFIKLPIQLCVLRQYINYDLAIRLSIPMCFGSALGLKILTISKNDLLLKRIFGYLITIISLYHLVNDTIQDSNNNNNIIQHINRYNYKNVDTINNEDKHSKSLNKNIHTLKKTDDDDDEKFKIDTRTKEVMIYITGFAAGLLAGIYGTGGPPLMILATHIKINKNEWRATCTLTYMLQNLVAATFISTYDEYRIKTGKEYVKIILLIVTVLIALYYGNIIADKINTDLWKKLILFLLMIGSGIMICSGYSIYVQCITILMLISLHALVYCITLKYLGVEIISNIRNHYYNINEEIHDSLPSSQP